MKIACPARGAFNETSSNQHVTQSLPLEVYHKLLSHSEIKNKNSVEFNVSVQNSSQEQHFRVFQSATFNEDTLVGSLVTFVDITDAKKAKKALHSEKERLRVTLQSIGDAVIATDTQGYITFINPIAERMTGWRFKDNPPQKIEDVMLLRDSNTKKPLLNPLYLALSEQRTVGMALNSELLSHSHRVYAVEDSAAPIRDEKGEIIGAIMVFHDVSEAMALAVKMSHLANYDQLTDLPNRILLQDRLTVAIQTAARQKHKVATLLLDIDNFKYLNDSIGHLLGDQLICKMARRIQKSLPSAFTLARLGGDEFTVIAESDHELAFETLAQKTSEDPSAKKNKGNLGYFTAMQMVYPFENAAFQTPVGQVSRPIRTQFGYHLVFVEDRRPAQGDIKVAHIMIKYYNPAQIDSTKERIEAVYTKLQDGADWNTLVLEFSEDFNTNNQGGELSWINRTTPNIPIEFKDVAYTLKTDGDISKPIKTRFGWHIVKRLESKPLPTLNDSREIIRRKVERDSRSELNKDVVVARIKNENNFRELAGIKAVKDSFTDLLLEGKYRKQKGKGIVLLTIGDREYTDDYFFGYVATNQNKSNKSLSNTVQDYYDDFIKRVNLDYEEGLLEQKYEDFKNIMQEYKDGILLFELTDKKVWSKAIKDSSGLALFYSKNIDNYMWKERLDASIYSCVDKKSAKRAMKLAKKGKSSGEILSKCNMDNAIAVTVESTKFERNSKPILDQINWEKGVQKLADENERFKFVVIHEVLPPTQKLLDENRGIVTSDYQNYLEKKWIEQLNTLFPVQLFENNISRLYSNP